MRTRWLIPLLLMITLGAACSGAPKLPIDEAAKQGQLNVVRWHVEHGADVNRLIYGRTSLHVAALNGHEDVVRYLLDHGAKVNAQTATGETPVEWAKGKGQEEVVRLLIRHGARI